MTKTEILRFMKKIKAYYQEFSLEDYVIEEWEEGLKPYEKEDVENKFQEHINGSLALEPPKLHFITKFLKTKEEKEKYSEDFLIRCDLCKEEMYYSDYIGGHRDKCLVIMALIPILKKHGDDVDYKKLDVYEYETLDRLFKKYQPTVKNNKEILKKIDNMQD